MAWAAPCPSADRRENGTSIPDFDKGSYRNRSLHVRHPQWRQGL